VENVGESQEFVQELLTRRLAQLSEQRSSPPRDLPRVNGG
jgi:hypothetical protein